MEIIKRWNWLESFIFKHKCHQIQTCRSWKFNYVNVVFFRLFTEEKWVNFKGFWRLEHKICHKEPNKESKIAAWWFETHASELTWNHNCFINTMIGEGLGWRFHRHCFTKLSQKIAMISKCCLSSRNSSRSIPGTFKKAPAMNFHWVSVCFDTISQEHSNKAISFSVAVFRLAFLDLKLTTDAPMRLLTG